MTKRNISAVYQQVLNDILRTNKSKLDEIDLWLLFQLNLLPTIRFKQKTLDRRRFFSDDFHRIIFVRHPFERLASAYQDKIVPSFNRSRSFYTEIRRAICKNFTRFYVKTSQIEQTNEDNVETNNQNDPCGGKVPTFEHFIRFIKTSSAINDVHWRPYSDLCQVCRIKYNFVGKYENIQLDLQRFRNIAGHRLNRFNYTNMYATGKSQHQYKSIFSQLPSALICFLKHFYRQDLYIFDYSIDDYLPPRRVINCHTFRSQPDITRH